MGEGYALNIELHPDGGFALTGTNGNIVQIPQSEKGLAILVRILTAEANASRRTEKTIGADASPVQYMIERWLVEDAKIKKEAEDTAKAELLRGLDFEL